MNMKTMMRLTGIAICALFMLPSGNATEEGSPISGGRYMSVVTDEDTGCEYIHTRDGGLYPRKASDGISHKGCNYGDPTNSAICIIRLPEGEKVSGNLGTGATHEILPGTSLSDGCFPRAEG